MILNHDCKEELRDLDLRATPKRLAILRLLENSQTPVDVTMILNYLQKQRITADPATVFRIVNMFTDRGITRQIELHEGKFRYELSNKAEHHHLICQNCGVIEDISDCNIEGLEKEIKQKKGFLVKSHSLEFFGVCKQCQH